MPTELEALQAKIEALTAAVSALTGRSDPKRADPAIDEIGRWYFRRATKQARYTLGPFLRDWGGRCVSELTKGGYMAWRDERAAETTLLRRPRSVGTLNLELATVLAMFRAAKVAGLVDENPLEGLRRLKGQRSRETEIEPQTHAQALQDAPLLVRVFQAACIETGARSGCEVRRMEWAHVNEINESIHIPRENTKGKIAARDVPLTKYLRDLLRVMPRVLGSPYIFANPETKQPYSAKHLCMLSRPYLDRLKAAPGDRRVVTHDARHSAVSRLARGGMATLAAMRLIGHASANQHWRYLHLSESDRAKAKQVLDAQRNVPVTTKRY